MPVMKKISFMQFDFESKRERRTWPELRMGQILYNTLYRMNRNLARELKGTENDPFNDDGNINPFYKWLGEKMGW